ncbi:MAG: hypothetical protein Q4G34_07400 [Micrococcus sp.]|nr:hypothetical protein [Micrococcus sp.]
MRRRITRALQRRVRAVTPRAAQRLLPLVERLPAPVSSPIAPRLTRLTRLTSASRHGAPTPGSAAQQPRDPRGLAAGPAGRLVPRASAGRGAAAVASDPESQTRLRRALGLVATSPHDREQRVIAGILGADLRGALEAAGYRTAVMTPGTAVAQAQDADVMVLDLAGFEGLWAGALDASGVALFLEVLDAAEAASERGATCWLVERGPHRHHYGALALRQSPHVVRAQEHRQGESRHLTEDPGEVRWGVLDVLSDVQEAQA